MIIQSTFTEAWIRSHRKGNLSKIDPIILEKMIRALSLVESLKMNELNFTFKGGTSLILLLATPKRFSIDIDILTTASREQVETVLQKICQPDNQFTHFTLNERRSYQPGIPKAHYSCYFNSIIEKKESYILLDILYQQPFYPEIISLPVQAPWLQTSEPIIQVAIPSKECLTGDKLTAFAPNTTGILYNQGKEKEIMKQAFDLGCLFDEISNIEIVSKTFGRAVKEEIKYRELSIHNVTVLDDIIRTGLLLTRREKQEDDIGKNRFAELQQGILQLKSSLFYGNFRIEEAIEATAKVAYLAAKVKANDFTPLLRFTDSIDLKQYIIIDSKFSYLNKLRRLRQNGALFYWHHALRLCCSEQ